VQSIYNLLRAGELFFSENLFTFFRVGGQMEFRHEKTLIYFRHFYLLDYSERHEGIIFLPLACASAFSSRVDPPVQLIPVWGEYSCIPFSNQPLPDQVTLIKKTPS